MVGTRPQTEELVYPVADIARKHGAGVEKETSSAREAYAGFPPDADGPYEEGTPPSLAA